MRFTKKAIRILSRSAPHQWQLNIHPDAKRVFDNLQASEKRAIFRRLRELLSANDPYSLPFVEMLQAKKFERIRKLRVGDYRVFFLIEVAKVKHLEHTYKGTLYLLDIRDRKAAY